MEKQLCKSSFLLISIFFGLFIQVGVVTSALGNSNENSLSKIIGKNVAEITVNGKVTDTLGNPLIGVTVQVKGSTTGSVTNATGQYQIKASEDAIL